MKVSLKKIGTYELNQSKPMFLHSLKNRIDLDGWYEWEEEKDEVKLFEKNKIPKKGKQKIVRIHFSIKFLKNNQIQVNAGLSFLTILALMINYFLGSIVLWLTIQEGNSKLTIAVLVFLAALTAVIYGLGLLKIRDQEPNIYMLLKPLIQ